MNNKHLIIIHPAGVLVNISDQNIYFGYHGNQKTAIFSHFCTFWAPVRYPIHEPCHVIHQNDHQDKF